MVRARSERAHSQVLDAAATLFAGRGIDATSMDQIAASSGVSKATIYKHWPDKEKLALEVLVYVHGLDHEIPVFNSGDLRADLVAQLSHQPAPERTALKDKIMPHLIAYSARNVEFGAAWRERVSERPRAALREMLMRAIKRGQLARALDVELGIAMLMGPMLYRFIFVNRKAGQTPPAFIEQVVDAFLRAFGKSR